MKIDRKDLYAVLYITIAALTLYIIYNEYKNKDSTQSNTILTNSNDSMNPIVYPTNSGLTSFNFNVPNTTSTNSDSKNFEQNLNGILASANSFMLDNVGNKTNSNLLSEFTQQSSFTSSNPMFTLSVPNNITQINENADSLYMPSIQGNSNLPTNLNIPAIQTPSGNLNTLVMPSNLAQPQPLQPGTNFVTNQELNNQIQNAYVPGYMFVPPGSGEGGAANMAQQAMGLNYSKDFMMQGIH
jgi:hypothetical protein